MDIQITKLIRGRGLCEQIISSHEIAEEAILVLIEQYEIRDDNPKGWLDDMKAFLAENGYHEGLDKAKRRNFRLWSISYTIIDGVLFGKYFNGTLLRYMNIRKIERIVKELHDGFDSGHFLVGITS